MRNVPLLRVMERPRGSIAVISMRALSSLIAGRLQGYDGLPDSPGPRPVGVMTNNPPDVLTLMYTTRLPGPDSASSIVPAIVWVVPPHPLSPPPPSGETGPTFAAQIVSNVREAGRSAFPGRDASRNPIPTSSR